MHLASIAFFGFLALFWTTYGLKVAYGSVRLPRLWSFPAAADTECPRISLLASARDEERKLPAALASWLDMDYPNLEVVVTDDRSSDATARILDEFAARDPRVRVVHVQELPAGWLGKPHGLQKAYERSSGEWLLFTDADVRYQRDALRRVVTLTRDQGLDHLSIMVDVDKSGFWDTVLLTFFGMGFQLATDPYQVSNPGSRSYVGVGAFQMMRRGAYEASGTHRRLAMEVIDDMKLGKLVKRAGFRSGVAVSGEAIAVEWHLGLGNLVKGLEKNFFAGAGFSTWRVTGQILALLIFYVAPFAGVVFARGWPQALAGVAACVAMAFHAGVDRVMRVSMLYALTMPLGAVVFTYMLARSTWITLRQGGIYWRETFYRLDELRKGLVE